MLAEYERRKARVLLEMKEEREHFNKVIEGLRAEYSLAENAALLELASIDGSKILHAEHIIFVGGSFANAGQDREWARTTAIEWILAGGKQFRKEYIGTKDYAQWHGQGETHTYGYGPKHGSMIFKIGFVKAMRDREEALTEEEMDACIYYLKNIERIQSIAETAKAAAKVA